MAIKVSLFLYVSLLLVSTPASALYKCEQDGRFIYSDIPCEGERSTLDDRRMSNTPEDIEPSSATARPQDPMQLLLEEYLRRSMQARELGAAGGASTLAVPPQGGALPPQGFGLPGMPPQGALPEDGQGAFDGAQSSEEMKGGVGDSVTDVKYYGGSQRLLVRFGEQLKSYCGVNQAQYNGLKMAYSKAAYVMRNFPGQLYRCE